MAKLWEDLKPQLHNLESDHLYLLIQTKDKKKELLSLPKNKTDAKEGVGSKVTSIKKARSKTKAFNNSKKKSA